MSYRSAAVAAVAAVSVVASGAAVTLADRSPTALPTTHRSPGVVARLVAPAQATLACPAAPSVGETVTSLFAVSPVSKLSRAPGGSLDLVPLGPTTRAVVKGVTEVGRQLHRTLRPEDPPALLVSASGGFAPGAAAAASSVLSSRRSSGLAATSCGPGANDWWFSAVDTSVGARSRLFLSNPTPAVAVVDLALFGPRGAIEREGQRGIAIAPLSQWRINLARFAPGVGTLTVNARAVRGSIGAAVLTTKLRGISTAGSEWVAPSAGPSNDLVINAAPQGKQQRLVLTNTSSREALAHVRVFDASGTFTATALGDLRIDPGGVVTTDLAAITNGATTGIRVAGNVPLTGAITTKTSGRAEDFTVSTSSEPITDPAVVWLLPDAEVSLLLTTPKPAGGSVRVASYDAAGTRVRSQIVTVRGEATTRWEPQKPEDTAYLVLSVRTGTGIRGMANYRSADGTASVPVVSGVWSIQRPTVLPGP